ncbi:hypothetical protein Ddye_012916 [Dipteronia dyeriana]|uniref:Uncharacterized protein n=1 Tax=Dipteronia dyeriana TaxID=168575 RepID=A0AAD9X5B9_9ROSI|nr:hypothetical protein Ddye_012916 [Dipteronia dyeriana]
MVMVTEAATMSALGRAAGFNDGFIAELGRSPERHRSSNPISSAVNLSKETPHYHLMLLLQRKAGKYVRQTYKEFYDLVIKVGNVIHSCGVEDEANMVFMVPISQIRL